MSLKNRLFVPMGADGVYARTQTYVHVLDQLEKFITHQRAAQAEVLRFPPVMSRAQLEKSGYLNSFPNLLGCACALHGSELEVRLMADRYASGEDWTEGLAATDLVLTPAACYPVYPIIADRGTMPVGGLQFDIEADCFRREPSSNLDRLQSFRMREFVRIGSEPEIMEFREAWMLRAPQLADQLGLPHSMDISNGPFFGRAGQMMAVSQRQQSLKFELLIPYTPHAKPTACMSFNYHRDHFGVTWNINTANDGPAHTSCVAFGMDRLTVALFSIHGPDPDHWPGAVKAHLAL